MTTTSRRSVLLGALGVAALAGCNGTATQKASSSAAASGSSQATLGLSYIPNIQFAPFYWALDKGLYTQQGVAATLRHHGASEALFTALTSGKEDLVLAGGDEAVQARAQGMDVVTVASFYQKYPIVLIVLQGSSITTLAQLKGHSIGIPGKYGESWFALQLALHNAGLTTADVKVVEVGYTQQAALATKKVDAVVGFSNNDAVQFAQSKVSVRQIQIGSSVPLVSSSLVTTGSFLKKQPELVKQVCQATVDGIKAVVDNPDEAVKTSTSHIPGLSGSTATASATATLAATIPLWKGDGQITGKLDAAQFTAMSAFMKKTGLISKAVAASVAMQSVLG